MALFWKFVIILILVILIYYRRNFKYTLYSYILFLVLSWVYFYYYFVIVFGADYIFSGNELGAIWIWYAPYLFTFWGITLVSIIVDKEILDRKERKEGNK
jgi:hypothetical protein